MLCSKQLETSLQRMPAQLAVVNCLRPPSLPAKLLPRYSLQQLQLQELRVAQSELQSLKPGRVSYKRRTGPRLAGLLLQ